MKRILLIVLTFICFNEIYAYTTPSFSTLQGLQDWKNSAAGQAMGFGGGGGGGGGGGYNADTGIGASATQIELQRPKTHVAECASSSDDRPTRYFRETSIEFWSTYLGTVTNNYSLKEFFNITNSKYSDSCDGWYRKYYGSNFHKALVFAYDKEITGSTSYWGFSNTSPSRMVAESSALKACEDSPDKEESHTCTVLFSNNDIKNVDYIALAKLEIPPNAVPSGSSWECHSDYFDDGSGICSRLPQNASQSDSGWSCDSGFIQSKDICISDIKIPENSTLSGSSWVCNSGYVKKFSINENTGETQALCETILVIPPNAYASGTSWACNSGFTKRGNSCIKTVVIPPNAYASGTSWACNSGFTKRGNSCIKTAVIPPNAYASGTSWACNSGYTKTGNTCTNNIELENIKKAKKIADEKAALARKTAQLDAQNYFNDLLDFLKIDNNEYDIIEIVGLVGTNKALLTEPWNNIIEKNFAELKAYTSSSRAFRDYHKSKNDSRQKTTLNELSEKNSRLKNINAYLRYFIQNNITSDIAQDVLTQIKIAEKGLKNQSLNELSDTGDQLERFIAKNNLSKDYLKYVKSIANNSSNTPEVTAKKIDANDLIEFEFMKNANRSDYITLVNLSGNAPNALLNLEGDVVFENDIALTCFYNSKAEIKNDLKFYLYDKVSDKEFLVQDRGFECKQANLLGYDLIFFEKGSLLKESKSYVASLASAIASNELQFYKKVTKEDQNEDFAYRASKVRQITEGVEGEMMLGFGSLIIDNSNTTLCTDVSNTLGQDSIMNLLSNEFTRMGYGKSVSNISFNTVEKTFTNVQKGLCGFIYADEGTLATLLNAFKISGTSYDILPIWYSKKMVESEQIRQESKLKTQSVANQKIKEQLDKDKKLAELRAEADGVVKKEQQDRLRKLNRNIVKSHVLFVKKEATLWLDEDPENTGEMLKLYPELTSFMKRKLKENWKLEKFSVEIDDYGLSDYRDRIIETFFTDIKFTLVNRELGEYEDFCTRVAILDDKEFDILREPNIEECLPGSMTNYKSRLDFQSSWIVE